MEGCPVGIRPHKTLYNRFVRWSRLGVFNRIFAELAGKEEKAGQLMIDATHLKAHRTAASLLKRGGSPPYRSHQGRPELEASCGLRRSGQACGPAALRRADERLQGSTCAAAVIAQSQTLIADRGYDADCPGSVRTKA